MSVLNLEDRFRFISGIFQRNTTQEFRKTVQCMYVEMGQRAARRFAEFG